MLPRFLNHFFLADEYLTKVYFFGPWLKNSKLTASVNLLIVNNSGNVLNSSIGVAQMPDFRSEQCALAFLNRFVFIIGGRNVSNGSAIKNYLFDSKTLNFIAIFNLTKPRWSPTCAILNDSIIIAGGARLVTNDS